MKNTIYILSLFLLIIFQSFSQTTIRTGSLNVPRVFHETQVLHNGKVLVFGGDDFRILNVTVHASAQLYDVNTGTWTNTGSMKKPRTQFASAILPNGNIMAIGGGQAASVDPKTASCEIYDVKTGTWSYTDSMHTGRIMHSAITLKNGKILVVGGDTSCELYDPSTNKWQYTDAPSLIQDDGLDLVLLADGRVLGTALHDAEIYNPVTETWTLLPVKLIGERTYHSSVLLNNGNVLITGSLSFSDNTTAEIFNPVTETFTTTGGTAELRANCKTALMDNGKVIVYGLGDISSAFNSKAIEIYDPATNSWSSNPSIWHGIWHYNIEKLGNGKFLIIGGLLDIAYSDCILIDQNIANCNSLPAINITAIGETVCYGKGGTITLNTSESSVNYTLKLGSNTIAKITGNGSALNIPIAANTVQAGTNVFTLYASKPGCPAFMLSDTAVVTGVLAVPTPVITSSSTQICAGDSMKLNAPAGYASYLWSTKASNDFIYAKTEGEYSVVVKSSNGCKSLPSDLANITHNPILPTSILITANKNTIVAGDLITVTATSENAGATPIYEWKINNVVTGGSSNVFSSSTINNGDIISCTLISSATCAKPQTKVSNSIAIVVTPYVDYPRIISTSPASNAVSVSNKQNITITFSKSMSFEKGIDTIIQILGSFSGKIKGTFTGSGTNKIVFTPSQYSNPGEKISVLIDSTLKDNTGISLKSGYNFELTVAAMPASAEFIDGPEISGLVNPAKIIPADFNNDRQMDFISQSSGGGVEIWMNQGNGTYVNAQRLALQYSVSDINVVDFNNDGNIDICIAYYSVPTLTILLNNTSGFSKKDFPVKYSTDKIFAGDFDGDADMDIVYKSNSYSNAIYIQKNDGLGNFNTGDYVINTPCNSFKIADFDNDGDLDLMAGSFTMLLLQNNGKAIFTSSTIPNPPVLQNDYPEIVSLGDYDSNGFMDAMIIFDKSIGIMKNTGNGNFMNYDTIGYYPRGIINVLKEYPSADFDGDGDLDLAITAFKIAGDDSIDIWTNNSHGKFSLSKRSLIGITTGLHYLIPMDIDGDGDIDLAASNRYLQTTFLKLNGGTKITITNPLPENQLCTALPVSIPFKKSGTFNGGNIFKLQLSDKNGSFGAPIELGSTSTNTEYILATFPSALPDGTHYRMRIISTNPAIISIDNGFDITIRSNCNILKSITPIANSQNSSSSEIIIATFTQEPQLPTSGINISGSFSGSYLNKGHISKSGNSLIFTPTSYFAGEKIMITMDSSIKSISGQQLTNPSVSTFTTGSKIAPALFTPYMPIDSTNINSILYLGYVGDLNTDGKIDVIARDQSTNEINVYFNVGDGSFVQKKNIYKQALQYGVTDLLDFDNDGDLDISVSQNSENILMLQNDGQANFTLIQTIPTGAQYFKSGDINNDGLVDFVSITENAVLNIFLNTKNTGFVLLTAIQLNEYISSLSVNDIDNDGDLDILYGTATNLWLLNNINSGKTFQKKSINTGFWNSNLVVSDFNNDKLLDIATDSKILFNDVNNTFSISKTINFGGSISNLNAADFDGDNNMDLIFQSQNDYTTTCILLNSGSGTFPILRKIKNSSYAIPADVDNDGDIDLVSFTNMMGASIRSFINDVSLKTQVASSTKFCSESTIYVQFTNRGIPEDVTYSAQLSDASGSFASPLIIGTGKTSPISCTISTSTPLGNGYRIRIVCDSVHIIGTDNGIDLTLTTNCPSISSLNPAAGDYKAEPSTNITATFTKDMLTSSANAGTFYVFKNYTGFSSNKGTFTSPDPKSLSFNPDQNYFPGEKISVTLTKQIENTDQTPLGNPFVYNFNVKPKASAGSFYMQDDVFVNHNQQQMAVKSADLDNDGDLDLVTLYSYENKMSIRLNNQGYFGTKTDYSCGKNPIDFSISDIDADGDADIITINYSGEHISIFKNNGDATFLLTSSLRCSGIPMNICIQDFDGDGDMDFATMNAYTFSCHTNDGTGNFKETFVSPGFGYDIYVNCLAASDIDSDGDIDIIGTTYGASNSIITLLNNGQGSFTRKDQFSVPNIIYYMYAADFNNDGKTDFAVSDGSSKSFILGTNKNGTFEIETVQTQQTVYRIHGGDIDGDGDIDLLVPNVYPMGLSILKNNGSASFTSSQFIDMDNQQPDGLEPFDVDNDGDLDIAMTGANELRMLINGQSSITTQSLVNTSICGKQPFTVPFKLYGQSSVNTFNAELSDATGSFTNPTVIGTGTASPLSVVIPANIPAGNAYRVRVVSTDQTIIGTDNRMDITLTQDCFLISSLIPAANSTNINSVNSIETDFTTDLSSSSINTQSLRISGNYSGDNSTKGTVSLSSPSSASFHSTRNFFPNEKVSVSLTTLLKNSNNTYLSKPFVYEFSVKPAVSSGKFFIKKSNYDENPYYSTGYTNAKLIRSGDFDNDGNLDIVMIEAGTSQLSVYLNTDKKLKIKTDIPCYGDPRRLDVLDFDADGYLDLITENQFSISLYRNNGDGTFILKRSFPLSNITAGLALADFNGDGNMDFATCSFPVGISVNTNMGNETFAEQIVNLTVYDDVIDLASMDIDSDGDIDIIAYSSDPFNLYAFENNGYGIFSYKNKICKLNGAIGIQVADFNNDNKMDFITAKNIIGEYYIGFNDGNTFTVKQVDVPYYHVFFDLADIDGDGDIDLICSSLDYSEGITIMKNDGTGAFTVSETFFINKPIVLFAPNDIDNDGDLDIVCANKSNIGLFTLYNGAAPADEVEEVPTDIKNGSLFNIHLYPNPSNDYINIDSPDVIQEIIVYNVLGEEVLRSNHTKQINVSALASGIYNIKIITDKGTAIQKVCIE